MAGQLRLVSRTSDRSRATLTSARIATPLTSAVLAVTGGEKLRWISVGGRGKSRLGARVISLASMMMALLACAVLLVPDSGVSAGRAGQQRAVAEPSAACRGPK